MKRLGFGRREAVVEVSEDEHAPFEMPGVSGPLTLREETWAEILWPAARFALLYVLGILATLVALYAILAGTLLFVAHVDNARLYVTRTTYPGGVPTLNSEAFVSTQPDRGTLLSNLETGFLGAPNASIYRVHSGPYDKVRFTDGRIYVNDRAVGSLQTPGINREVSLGNQYLAQCVAGACTTQADKWAIVPAANIYGEVRRGW